MKKLSVLLILLVVCCMSLPASAASSSKNPSFEEPGVWTDPEPANDPNFPRYWFRWGSDMTDAARIIYREGEPVNAYDGNDFIETNFDGQWAGFSQNLYTNHYHAHYTAKGGYTNIPNDVNVDEIYTLNSYAKDPNGTGATFVYKFEYYSGPNDTHPAFIREDVSDPLPLTGSWVNHQFQSSVPADANRLTITWVAPTPLGSEGWFDLSELLSGGPTTPCQKTKDKEVSENGYFAAIPGDFDQDCYVDMYDVDELVASWLDCSLDPNTACP